MRLGKPHPGTKVMSGGQPLIENRLSGDGESGKFTTMKSPVVYLQSVQN